MKTKLTILMIPVFLIGGYLKMEAGMVIIGLPVLKKIFHKLYISVLQRIMFC